MNIILWYLSECLVIFTLFSDQTSTEKQKMAKELLKYQCDKGFPSNTRVQQMSVLQQQTQIHNLVGNDSWFLFKLLQSN